MLAEQGTVIDDVAETIATKTSVQFPGGLNAVSKPELSALLPSSAATFAAGLAAGSAVVRRAGTRVQPLPAKTGPITTAEPVEATLRSWVGGRAVKRPPSEAAKPVLTPAKSPVPRAKPVANLVGVPVKPLVGSGKVAVDVRSPAPVERNGPVQRSEDVRKTEPVRSAQSVRSTEPIRHPEGVQHSEHVRKLDDLSGAPAELSGSATLATVPVTSAQTQVAALTSAGPEEGAPEREPAGDVQTGSSVFGFGQGTESGTVLTTVPGIDGLGPEFADDPAITAQGLGERKRPSLTVDVTGAVADADGVTLSGRATVSGRKRGGAVEEDGARSPIPDAKARLAMMKEYGRQQVRQSGSSEERCFHRVDDVPAELVSISCRTAVVCGH